MEQARLFAECDVAPDPLELERLQGVDGLVVDPVASPAELMDDRTLDVVLRCECPDDYPAWKAHPAALWATGCGLEGSAQLREEHPAIRWLPRLEVFKAVKRYQFSNVSDGEGFKFYMPDSASIHGYVVAEGGQDISLHKALARATQLGFERLWLHAHGAEAAAAGYDLEMLIQARAGFAGELWLSGGAKKIEHLENLAGEGGAAVAIVPETLVQAYDEAALRTALKPPMTEVPIEFVVETRIV